MALELGLLRTKVEGREIDLLVAENFLVAIERTARGPHRDGGDFGDEQWREPAVIHRIGMQRVAGLMANRAALAVGHPKRAIGGHKRIFDYHAARAGALHPDDVPVVDDFELIAMEQNPSVAERSLGFRIVDHGGSEEMRSEIAAGGIVPSAFHAIAAVDGNADAGGHADAGRAKIAGRTEDLALGVFG